MAARCPVCGEVLETEEEMDAHDHEIPLELRNAGAGFSCPICGAEFDTAEHLVEHEATHVKAGDPDPA
jgi:C4-type Zn-finger protein